MFEDSARQTLEAEGKSKIKEFFYSTNYSYNINHPIITCR